MTQDCPICINAISSPWGVCSPCGHPLHNDCWRDLLRSSRVRQCPLCNSQVTRFVKVYMDLPNSDSEQIKELEAVAMECKEKSDYYLAQMITSEEEICNLKDDLERSENNLISNAQHLSTCEGENRELRAKICETETIIEDLRSDLQYATDNVHSHKHKIRRLERQIRDKDVEIEKTCSSAARTLARMNARVKVIHQLQAKLKEKDEKWKVENECLHGVILVLRFLFSILAVLLLFLWIFDYGSEESARRTVLNILTAVVSFNGLVLDCNPALKALTATWLVMIISNIVAGI
eukprot:scaffold4146_cov151-Skeletonema_menzelii.AAC.2